jgi:hypothetical protein
MSMKTACSKRTICEVLREINDILQGESVHPLVLPKLQESERMAKKIVLKLLEYNKDADAEWWDNNPNYESDLKRRMESEYIA